MDTSALAAWALALMLAKAPPERIVALNRPFNRGETVQERRDRYRAIADAAAAIGKDKATTTLLLAVSRHETSWDRDTDLGPTCERTGPKDPRCDFGKAACSMQIRTDIHVQWKAADLFADRRACFRAGLQLLRGSMKACASIGADHAFDAYAGGMCLDGELLGLKLASRKRSLQLFDEWGEFKAFRAPSSPGVR